VELIRQHSDYAMRLMLQLAQQGGGEPLSVRVLAERENISYQFACKILQNLHKADLVVSAMGTRGGYGLSRSPDRITMAQVLEAVQGRPLVNRCTKGILSCPRQGACPVNKKLEGLQTVLDDYLAGVTLKDLLSESAGSIMAAVNEKGNQGWKQA
jgi:Rrf2 family protein